MLAYVVPTDGDPRLKDVGEGNQEAGFPGEDQNLLKSLEAEVGGYLEAINIPDERSPMALTALMNEDGKSLDLPPNPTATRLISPLLIPGDYIAGTMLIVGEDDEGRYVSLPDDFQPEKYFYPL